MKAKRRYHQSRRAEAAQQTRSKILSAARALFGEEGFHRVSMDEIALRAGVGRTTVFQQFESKKGLLRAVEHDTSERAGVARLFLELAGKSARESMRIVLELSPQIWAAEEGMFARLFGLAFADEDMRKVIDEKESGRREIIAAMVGALKKDGALTPGTSASEATDLLTLITGFHAFERLRAQGLALNAITRMLKKLAAAAVTVDAGSKKVASARRQA